MTAKAGKTGDERTRPKEAEMNATNTTGSDRPKLLVATDGSDAALRAAGTAVGLAGPLGAKLHILYVVDEDGAFRSGIHYGEAVKELAEFGGRAAREAAALAERAGVEHEETIVTGDPARAILSVAGDVGADYVVLGATGTSRLGHALFRSVSEEVLRRSDRRVLVVGGKPTRAGGTSLGRPETSGARA